MENIKQNQFTKIFFILATSFLFVSLVLAGLFILFVSMYKNNEGYLQAEATIIEIDDFNDHIKIEYEDKDGQIHQIQPNFYSSSYYVGKKLTIYYSEENPEKIQYKPTYIIAFSVFGTMSLIFFGVSLTIYIIAFNAIFTRKIYIQKGVKSKGTVTQIKVNWAMSIGSYHPQKIYCKTRSGEEVVTTLYSKKYIEHKDNLIIDIYSISGKNKKYADPYSIKEGEVDPFI